MAIKVTQRQRDLLDRLEDKGLVGTMESCSRMPCSGGEKIMIAWLLKEDS